MNTDSQPTTEGESNNACPHQVVTWGYCLICGAEVTE